MARPSSGSNLTIAQLQKALSDRKSELDKLHKQRSALEKKVAGVDRQIERIGGTVNGGRGFSAGGRARNAKSLMDTIEGVLDDAGKPMKVLEIMEGVLATGYKSGSANFRGIINQTLIKDKRFAQAERGVYQLKAGGETKKK